MRPQEETTRSRPVPAIGPGEWCLYDQMSWHRLVDVQFDPAQHVQVARNLVVDRQKLRDLAPFYLRAAKIVQRNSVLPIGCCDAITNAVVDAVVDGHDDASISGPLKALFNMLFNDQDEIGYWLAPLDYDHIDLRVTALLLTYEYVRSL